MERYKWLRERTTVNSKSSRDKSVSLTLRGFDRDAQEVISLVGTSPSSYGNRGEPVRPSVKTLLTRSYVDFSMSFPNDYALCNMFPALLTHLGGINHLRKISDQVQPEFVEINFDLPVKESDEIQEGYLPKAVISDVYELNATLSFSFS
jgi:hypothetical protein